jgi:multiple sugar transport system substrate-binding protein
MEIKPSEIVNRGRGDGCSPARYRDRGHTLKWSSLRWLSTTMVATLVLLTACTNGERRPSATDDGLVGKGRTVTFSTWMWEQPGIGQWWHETVKAFEAETGARVEVRNLPIGEFLQQIVVELSAGSPADIMTLPAHQLAEYASIGQLEPLDGFVDGSNLGDRIFPSAREFTTVEGKLVALPVAGRTLELMYNGRLFEKAGLRGPPTSTDEFLQYARALTVKKNGKVVQYGASMANGAEGLSVEYLLMWAVAFDARLAVDGKPTLTDPGVIKALEFMKTLYHENLIPRGLPLTEQRALFANETSAMQIEGAWNFPFIAKTNPDALKHIKTARVPWGGPSTGGPNISIALSGKSKNKDLGLKFLERLMSHENMSRFQDYDDTLPMVEGAVTEKQLAAKPYLKPYLEGFAADPVPWGGADGLEKHTSEFWKIILDAMNAALKGDVEPAAALQKAQQEAEARLG